MNNKNTFSRDKLSHAIKNALSGVVCSLLFVLPVHAVEFNVDMIDAEDRENIDISRFEKKGYIQKENGKSRTLRIEGISYK